MLNILRDMFSLGMAPAASMAAMQFVQFGNPSLIPTFHRLVWLSKPFWCSWVHFLLELRTGTWALSVHQVPSSSEWRPESMAVVSFRQLETTCLCVENVWSFRQNWAFTFPDCEYCRYRSFINCSDSVDSLLSYWITCWHRHSFCCICWLERLKLFFIWCNCKLGLD